MEPLAAAAADLQTVAVAAVAAAGLVGLVDQQVLLLDQMLLGSQPLLALLQRLQDWVMM